MNLQFRFMKGDVMNMGCCSGGYHEFNLDWFINRFKEIDSEIEEFLKKFDADLADTVEEILNKWKDDGTLNTILSQISQSIINVVLCGVDNTGSTDVSEKINDLAIMFTGRILYFPAGTYKINGGVLIRTDGSYKGNMLLCDPGALFKTDGCQNMFTFGNGGNQNGLYSFGFNGGYIDGKNVTGNVVLFNNKQYNPTINNLTIVNVGDATAVKIGTDTSSSIQAKINGLVISGDGTVKGYGLYIYGTDNYVVNCDVGRMKTNVLIAGGGNKFANLHCWNFGDEYLALGVSTKEEKITYPSIRVNGSNKFSNVQVDNGSPALEFTNNAVNNIISGLTLNYEDNFPWATSRDICRAVNILGQQNTIGTMILLDGVDFTPKVRQYIRLLEFPENSYDSSHLYWVLGQTIKIRMNTSRESQLRALEGDFARACVGADPVNVLSNYIKPQTGKCALVGYIGVNNNNTITRFSVSDLGSGEINVSISVSGESISVTSEKKSDLSFNGVLHVGNEIVTLLGKKFVPLYIEYKDTTTKIRGLTIREINLTDKLTSFVYNRVPTFIDIPDNTTQIATQ